MAGIWGSAAASKEHKSARCCAEPAWLGSSASTMHPEAQHAQCPDLLPTGIKNYKMVPQTDVSSLQPHVSLVRGKSRGYKQLNSARHQPGLATLFPAVFPDQGISFTGKWELGCEVAHQPQCLPGAQTQVVLGLVCSTWLLHSFA